jgi:hypothetical protein
MYYTTVVFKLFFKISKFIRKLNFIFNVFFPYLILNPVCFVLNKILSYINSGRLLGRFADISRFQSRQILYWQANRSAPSAKTRSIYKVEYFKKLCPTCRSVNFQIRPPSTKNRNMHSTSPLKPSD